MHFFSIYKLRFLSYNMSVVKPCNVLIITKEDGRESTFRTRGSIFRNNDCFHVLYRQESDKVLLRGNANFLEMKRGQLLTLCFRPRETTSATLKIGDREGSFSVYTSNLSFFDTDEIRIFLDYELQFPQDIQKFSLQISIQSISEEQ